MDINQEKKLKSIYQKYFSLSFLGTDISNKFAIISLLCYLKIKLSKKKPDLTYYELIKKFANKDMPDECLRGLAIVCEDFSYGCKNFITFELEDKDIPSKLKELLGEWLPF